MALPLLPLAGAGVALLFLLTKKADAASKSPYEQSSPEGSAPKKEPAPPAKTWKEMPPALQEQVAAALGALGVSPTTGKIEGTPTADAIKLATQTAALCESQGFYEVAKELNRLIGEAAPKVATPPEAVAIKNAAPPGLSPEQVEAIARTLTLDRDPKSIAALIKSLEQLPPSPQRDNFIQMAQALLLQLAAAQSTTQTMQQIEQVITSPGLPQLQQAIQPLPPAIVPVMNPASTTPLVIAPAPSSSAAPKAPTAAQIQKVLGTRILQAGLQGSDVLGWQQWLRLDGFPSLGADGKFGPATTTATKAWQGAHGLTADGKVGPATKSAIGKPAVKALPAAAAAVKPAAAPSAARVLQQGLSGADVKAWQEQLRRDGFNVTADGIFGAGTKTATVSWQKQRGIGADGKVGPATLAAIGRAPSATAPKPSAAAAPAPTATIPSGTLGLDSFPDPNPSAPLLQRGSKGDYVRSLQKVLKTFGYDMGTGGPGKDGIDGDFGPTVEKRLKEFQAWALGYYKDKRIGVDGKVGPITRRLIRLRAAELLKQAA